MVKYPNSFIIFDIETTGFSGKKDKCIEIGAIKVVEGKVISTFNVLLNHGIPKEKYIPHINGITYEMIEEAGIDPQRAYSEFLDFVKGSYEYLIGHNILKFDIPFLTGNFPNFGLLDKNAVIDTAALYKAKKLNLKPKETQSMIDFMIEILGQVHYGIKYSMDTACVEFKIDKSKVTQHRAIGDCLLTHELFKNLCVK